MSVACSTLLRDAFSSIASRPAGLDLNNKNAKTASTVFVSAALGSDCMSLGAWDQPSRRPGRSTAVGQYISRIFECVESDFIPSPGTHFASAGETVRARVLWHCSRRVIEREPGTVEQRDAE
jgi:hypothetical protein